MGTFAEKPHPPDRLSQLTPDRLTRQPQHPMPQPLKHPLPPLISRNPPRMPAPINFHNQARSGRNQINDVPTSDELTAKSNPKSLTRDTAPKDFFFRCVVPHEVSAFCEKRLELCLLPWLPDHEDLRCPANQMGFATGD
jgi:hypothetical protein